MTEIEVIDFTVEHFQNNPRSLGSYKNIVTGLEISGCVYNGENGEHCAFALFCENPKDLIEGRRASMLLIDETARLKPEVSHIRDKFWSDLQGLHDSDEYWSGVKGQVQSLSLMGENKVKDMKKMYK